MALVPVRCGEAGCAFPVRRADLDTPALALVDHGVMPKPGARLCVLHQHERVNGDAVGAQLAGTADFRPDGQPRRPRPHDYAADAGVRGEARRDGKRAL